jgi:hypothetical protein
MYGNVDVDATGDLARRESVWAVLVQQRRDARETRRSISFRKALFSVGHVLSA